MEIRLDDNSKITFEWARPGLLNVQFFRPSFTKHGHGWLLRASALLDGQDLQRFLDGLTAEQEQPGLPPAA